jgi:hypothetical protein
VALRAGSGNPKSHPGAPRAAARPAAPDREHCGRLPTRGVFTQPGGCLSDVELPDDDELEQFFIRFLRGGEELFAHCCNEARISLPGPYGLTRYERLSVWIYSSTDSRWYERVNSTLRGLNHDPDVQLFAAILNKALEKLPRYQGRVYRRIRMDDLDAVAAGYEPGTVRGWTPFTSSSKSLERALRGNVLFIIGSQNGRVLGEYADKPSEEEVLFRTGLVFEVLALERRPNVLVVQVAERNL